MAKLFALGLCLNLVILLVYGMNENKDSMTLDVDENELDDENLHYNSDVDSLTEDNNSLDQLIVELKNSTEPKLENCQKYKSQINDICYAKFAERTRFRAVDPNEEAPQVERKPFDTIATPQQICCEFRLTYLKCLVSSLNFACPTEEFNSFYNKVQGLSEFCSRFFAKSNKIFEGSKDNTI